MEKPSKKDFEVIIKLMERDANKKLKIGVSQTKLFLLSSKNELIVEFNLAGKELIIREILIHNQRRGIGSFIVNFLKEYAKEKGYLKLTILNVQDFEFKRFVKRLGFSDTYIDDFSYEYLLQEPKMQDKSQSEMGSY